MATSGTLRSPTPFTVGPPLTNLSPATLFGGPSSPAHLPTTLQPDLLTWPFSASVPWQPPKLSQLGHGPCGFLFFQGGQNLLCFISLPPPKALPPFLLTPIFCCYWCRWDGSRGPQELRKELLLGKARGCREMVGGRNRAPRFHSSLCHYKCLRS